MNKTENLCAILPKNTAALILSDVNRFYFSGFDASDGAVFVCDDAAYGLFDFRYIEKAREVVKDLDVLLLSDFYNDVNALIDKHGIEEILVETDYVSVARFDALSKNLKAKISNCGELTAKITEMRAKKSREELSLIKSAQKLTDMAFSYITERIATGRTEKEIALDMEFFMRNLGSEGVSFDFIVVSGKNSSLPHGVPTDKKIEKGDFVTMDFGGVVGGYRSDMTRTVAVGSVSDEQKSVYETVLKAQRAALDFVKPGVICADVDKVARDIIYNAGYEGCFGHALGHSVGIDVHESPAFSPRCKTVLQKGTVMTVEPGIYLENKFGVRIEDMIFIEDPIENLTNSPKELIIL